VMLRDLDESDDADRTDSPFTSTLAHRGQNQQQRGPNSSSRSAHAHRTNHDEDEEEEEEEQQGEDTQHPPFREDTESVPYSPSADEHRPESASLDESFAGPSLALYDFVPENDNELELREGQIIQVGYRHGQGWLVAMNMQSGEQGLVPEEYVRLLRDIEGWGEDEEMEEGSDDEGEGDGNGDMGGKVQQQQQQQHQQEQKDGREEG